jgi:23S rRNA pseudouridine1911/1915/1917 synthase
VSGEKGSAADGAARFLPLTVLYEDKNLIVCLKPAGVVSEEAERAVPAGAPVSMPALLRAHWGRADAPVYPVHRLDTPAAGVMVYARTAAAAAALSRQVQGGALQKEYRCVCAGVPAPAAGRMEDWLFKDSRQNRVYPVRGERRGARRAVLAYAVLAVLPRGAAEPAADFAQPCPDGARALCAVRLETGRTHQIRAQFAARRHPLCGDGKYGSREKGALALWCRSLTFTPPGETAPRTFSAEPPAQGAFAPFAKKDRPE